jgi:hypothetical protein
MVKDMQLARRIRGERSWKTISASFKSSHKLKSAISKASDKLRHDCPKHSLIVSSDGAILQNKESDRSNIIIRMFWWSKPTFVMADGPSQRIRLE